MAAELRRRIVHEEKDELEEYREVLDMFANVYKDAIEDGIRQIHRLRRRITTLLDDPDLSEREREALITREKEKVFEIAEGLLASYNTAREDGPDPAILRKAKKWLRDTIQSGIVHMSTLLEYIAKIIGTMAGLGAAGMYAYSVYETRGSKFRELAIDALNPFSGSLEILVMALALNSIVAASAGSISSIVIYLTLSKLLRSTVSLLEYIPLSMNEEDETRVSVTIQLLNDKYDRLLHVIDQVAGSSECSICFSEYTQENPKVYLPCGHSFHSTCIIHTFRNRNRCPFGCPEVSISPESSIIRRIKDVPINKLKYGGMYSW